MGSLLQNLDTFISTFKNELFDSDMGETSSKKCIVCSWVCLLTGFLKVFQQKFSLVSMLVRIFNSHVLVQSWFFGEDSYLTRREQKIGFET